MLRPVFPAWMMSHSRSLSAGRKHSGPLRCRSGMGKIGELRAPGPDLCCHLGPGRADVGTGCAPTVRDLADFPGDELVINSHRQGRRSEF